LLKRGFYVAFQSAVKPWERMRILFAFPEMEKFLSACNFREILFPGYSLCIETCLRRRDRPEVSHRRCYYYMPHGQGRVQQVEKIVLPVFA
jgi:hypothetical protein